MHIIVEPECQCPKGLAQTPGGLQLVEHDDKIDENWDFEWFTFCPDCGKRIDPSDDV